MTCLDTREWLLHAVRPADRAAAPVEVARHLNGCADCQRLTARLDRLERAYRTQPLPESAGWLARNDDPVEEAWRFDAFADKLLERVSAHADHPDPAAAGRVARHYQKVIDRGVAASLAKAAKKPALDFDHKHRLEKI